MLKLVLQRSPHLLAGAVLLVLAGCGGSETDSGTASAGGNNAAASQVLAATPPMGWNSWNTFFCKVTEQDIRQAADALVSSGLRDAGYQYVNIDDCWHAPERDAEGKLQANAERFPSGIAALADYVHSRGLKLGIYASPLEKMCSGTSTGSLGHEVQDADTFAAWGVDYLKYDYCSTEGTLADQIATFTKMRDALRSTGRPIVYSINSNSGSHEITGQAYDWGTIANLWRTTQDVNATWDNDLGTGIHSPFFGIINAIDATEPLAAQAGPGHWNDADMLVVGTQAIPAIATFFGGLSPATTQPLSQLALYPTLEEMRSQFSMWSMMAAPLIAGNDLTQMPPDVLAILGNRDVIAVNQDPLGIAGTAIVNGSDAAVWARPLRGGAVAVALLNRSKLPMAISTTAGEVGLPAAPTYQVKDLWSGQLTTTTGAITATVPGHGVAMLRLMATP